MALIAGPTASGKSALAVALAQAVGRAQVINADASQVYRDLTILSARPTAAEMQGVPHHLFGHVDGADGAYHAARWAAEARRALARAWEDDDIPILVGGTGLYLRTLLDGIAPVPEIDPAIRAAVRALPVAEAYAALRREDPERAAALAPADATRISRALEVVRATGRSLAAWQTERTGGIGARVALHPAILLPDRQSLYARCDGRFSRMLAQGAVAEVEALLARDLDPALPVMRAIGVPEIAAYLRGECTLAQAETRGAQATRNYAKRQFTWLRHQPPAEWRRVESEPFLESGIFEILFP